MSAAPPPAKLTKKQLKALAHHKSASGVPAVSTATAEETGDGDATTPTLAARGKKTKNKRKIARDEKAGDDVIGDEEDEVMGEEAEEERQAKRKQKQEKAKAPVKKGEGEVDEDEGKEGAAANAKPKTKARYIIFVGNLPFTTTAPELQTFFEGKIVKGQKPQVRLLTSKPDPNAKGKARAGGQSRGIAFVEFSCSAHLQAALLLHQCPFPTPDSPRLLNIELTSGGGGTSLKRKAKIGEKNQAMRAQAGMQGMKIKEDAEREKAEKGDEGWEGSAAKRTRRGEKDNGDSSSRGGRGGTRGNGRGGRGGRGGGGRGGGIALASSRPSKWSTGTGANGVSLG